MRIFGIDPGLRPETSHAVRCELAQRGQPSGGLRLLAGCMAAEVESSAREGDVIVIEWPTWQGEERSNTENYSRLGDEAWRIRRAVNKSGCRVFCPPVYEVRSLLRFDANAGTGWDRYLRDYLRRCGMPVGNGSILSQVHRRDAFLTTLWWLHNVALGHGNGNIWEVR